MTAHYPGDARLFYWLTPPLLVMSPCKKSLKIPKVNQNPYLEEEQTTQWPKQNVKKDKQRTTKHSYKTKDRVT